MICEKSFIYRVYICIGLALIIKAEFDSALSDFNARLTTFEAGINSKIDSQVSSYLDRNGIWQGKAQTITQPTSTWLLNVPINDEFKVKNQTVWSYCYYQSDFPLEVGQKPNHTILSASITSDEDGKVWCAPPGAEITPSTKFQYLYSGHHNGGLGHYLSTDKGDFANIPIFKCNKTGLAYVTGRDQILCDIGEMNSFTTPEEVASYFNQFLLFNNYASPLRHPGELSTMIMLKDVVLREFNAEPTIAEDEQSIRDVVLSHQTDMYTFNSRYETRDMNQDRYKNGAYSRLQLTASAWESRSAFSFVQKDKWYAYDYRLACSDSSERNYFLSHPGGQSSYVIKMDPINVTIY